MDTILIVLLITIAAVCVLALGAAHFQRTKLESRIYAMATGGRLAVGMAHDLNNMLTVIIGHVELLNESRSWEHVKTTSDEIRELCECAGRLTGHVLSMVNPNVADVRMVDAATHIRDLETVLDTISGRSVQFHLNVTPLSAYLQIPPSDLDQLLVNLVLNAREAGATTIRVCVTSGNRIASDRYWLNIEVVDDGRGMSEHALARATDELFSANKPSGTGIGLSTVKRVVAASGGHLELRNRDRGGVMARIALPGVAKPGPGES